MQNRRWVVVAVAALFGGAILSATGVLIYNRAAWGNWSPFSPPEHFTLCSGHFYRFGERSTGDMVVVSRAQALHDEPDGHLIPMLRVGLLDWQVYRTSGSNWRCTGPEEHLDTMYIKIGADRYLMMTDAN